MAEAKDPDALSGEYHKARKQLMLWAGILFIWELVGIDLDKAKEAGNAGAIITAIKSPQAIPWVLLILVGYFLFKLWVEWNQCGERRRKLLPSRIDFGSGWVVAFLAFALYGYQAVSRIQVADVVQRSNKVQSVMMGFLIAFPLISLFIGMGIKRHLLYSVVPIAVLVLSLLFAMFLWRRGSLDLKYFLLGAVGYFAAGVVTFRHNPIIRWFAPRGQ